MPALGGFLTIAVVALVGAGCWPAAGQSPGPLSTQSSTEAVPVRLPPVDPSDDVFDEPPHDERYFSEVLRRLDAAEAELPVPSPRSRLPSRSIWRDAGRVPGTP